jgi:hypothetical protein
MLGQELVHRTGRHQMPYQSPGIQQLTIDPHYPLHPIRIDLDHAEAGDRHADLFSALLARGFGRRAPSG